MYNLIKLTEEIQSAGIPIHGVSSDGRIDFKDATEAQKLQAEQIKNAHDPSETEDQKLTKKGFDRLQAAIILVINDKTNAPQWAKDTVSQAATKIKALLN